MKKFVSILLLSSVCLLTLCGCKSYESPEDTPIVLKINGEEFHAAQVAEYMSAYKAECESNYVSMLSMFGDTDTSQLDAFWDTDEMQEDLRETGLSRLLTDMAIEEFMEEHGLSFTEEDQQAVDEKKDSLILRAGSSEKFAEYIASQGYTEKSYDHRLRMNQCRQIITEYCFGPGGAMRPSDEELADYYNQYYYKIQIISLAKTSTNIEGVTKQDIANDVLEQALSGADFDTLIAQYNEATQDHLVFSYSCNLESVLVDAAIMLEENEVCDTLVDGAYSYYIIKRVPLDEDALFAPDGLYDGTSIAEDVAPKIGSLDDVLSEITDAYDVERLDAFSKMTSKNLEQYRGATETAPRESTSDPDGSAADTAS